MTANGAKMTFMVGNATVKVDLYGTVTQERYQTECAIGKHRASMLDTSNPLPLVTRREPYRDTTGASSNRVGDYAPPYLDRFVKRNKRKRERQSYGEGY